MSPAMLLLSWLLSVDGGAPAPAPPKPQLTALDREVVDHLELLESLDTADDLDLLQELSVER
jgi:hypothetical protein